MIYMLDTANIEAIAMAVDLYPLAGVTTNPSIIAKENRPLREILLDIREVIGSERMLHAQVMGKDAEVMLEEAKALRGIDHDIIVKVPVTPQGLKAMKLIAAEGIRITATAILTPQQALMAAVAGAEFLAPYVNRLDNICSNGVQVASEMVHLINTYQLDAKVLAASFKNVQQVHEVTLAGAHSVTIAPDVFDQLLVHPLTESGVAGFVNDWEAIYGHDKTVLDVI
ncbi:fructose-6-phosphate aldolase [Photobacterium alginatilyticum]|uniref:Fructose-6-phosphate aldolase n=1 Tax=Photobacterium alginatilyticum TaxID=1775171 RepID=A0ABW9YDD2_9GAMM|nr:fructose-6-phosphate aldolase [Photobacterium alginatilyticum]NBI51779.1 fructose-6-phosphate aldolase [Photobacterium alginatilyticum]